MKWKMNQKILAMFLTLGMIVSFCGCTDSQKTTSRQDADGGDKKTEDSQKNSEGDKEPAEITMVLDWTPNTNHTGLYVAREKGYFEEAGLKVSIIQPPDNGATDLVASGGAQFGIDFQDTLAAALSGDEPLPVTAVAAVLQHNTSGLVSRKELGIDSPKKLEGHSYATWDSPIEQATLKKVVSDDGGEFGKVKLISTYVEDIVAALNADIDSVWIYYGWDGIKCELEKIETNYLPLREMDEVFDYYSPVIIAGNDYLQTNPNEAKAFLAAVKKGYEFAAQNPDEAAQILLNCVPELDGDLVKASQKYLSGQYIADAEKFGMIDAQRWNRFYNWLNDNDLVENKIPENTGFSNEYLG